MKCSQCGKPAMFLVGPDDKRTPLCLECNLKFVQLTVAQNEMYERQINYLTDQMEVTVGLPGLFPRFPVRRPPQTVQTGDITLNNIKVDRSVVGVLNTGTIETVDSAVTALHQSGDDQLSAAIQELTQAVVNNNEVVAETKNKILEILSVVATEATAPKERRRLTVIRALLHELAGLMGGAAALGAVWDRIRPILEAAFGTLTSG